MVKIVTDSLSDISPEVAANLGITVIPLNVHFGDEIYKDSIDLSPDEFYKKLVGYSRRQKKSKRKMIAIYWCSHEHTKWSNFTAPSGSRYQHLT